MSEIVNISTLCRCCHADGEFRSLETQYMYRNEYEIFSVYLRDTFGIWIEPPTLDASYSICEECIVRLRDARRFKNQVLQCEEKFREYCMNQEVLLQQNIEIKKENHSDDDQWSDTNNEVECNGTDEFQNEIEEIYIKSDDNIKEDSPVLEVKEKKIKKQTNKVKATKSSSSKNIKKIVKADKSTKKPLHKNRYDSNKFVTTTENGVEISCLKCGHVFNNDEDFLTHFKSEHSNLQCTQCLEIFTDNSKYQQHLIIHSKQYICSVCKKKFNFASYCKSHMKTHLIKTKDFICDYCKNAFCYKTTLITHINTMHIKENDKEFVCETCGHAFRQKCALKTHIEVVHNKVKRFSCHICPNTYTKKTTLVSHINRHAGLKPFKCKFCPKTFFGNGALIHHRIKVHGNGNKKMTYTEKKNNKIFDCRYCIVVCQSPGELRNHVKTHEATQPYKCELCYKGYTSQYSLRRHFETHKGIKPYNCDICHKKFSTKLTLTKHKKNVHEIKKPERTKCHICKLLVYDLKKHLLCHENRPYKCHLCDKKYSANNILNRHINVEHKGVRFKCNLCPKGYTKSSNLSKHKLNVHNVVHKVEDNFEEA